MEFKKLTHMGTPIVTINGISVYKLEKADSLVQFNYSPVAWFNISGNSIKGYYGNEPNIVLPASYSIDDSGIIVNGNDYPITTIAQKAFASNTIIESVVIPDGYETIAHGAFTDCENLKDLYVADSVSSVISYITDCCPLEKVYIGKTLCERNLSYGNPITSDGKLIISKSSGPSDITPFIMNVEWDENFSDTILEGYMFYGGGFTHIELPNSIETLETYAIYGNVKLKEIVLDSNIKSIEWGCFYKCKNLEKITINTITPPTMESNSFNNTNSTFKIYVPANSLNAYKTATNWSAYASRIYPIEE